MAVVALVPIVPVAAHQVVVYASLRLVHILVDVGRTSVCGVNLAREEEFLLGGGYAVGVDALVYVGYLTYVAAVGVHRPHLHRAAAVGEKIDAFRVAVPLRRGGVRRCVGQGALAARRHVVQEYHRGALVLLHVVACDRIYGHRTVGREGRLAQTSHLPHHFGCEACGADLFGREQTLRAARFGHCLRRARGRGQG